MCHHHRGKWIVARLQLRPALTIRPQLHHWKHDAHPTAPETVFVAHGAPCGAGIGEHCQTDHRAVIAVEQAVVVDIHALGEVRIALPLDFDMDEHELLDAVAAPDAYELVGQAGPQSGIAHNLLQFGVETLIAPGPVNLGGGSRKEKGHKSREGVFEHLFPGAIIVRHRRAALLCVRTLRRAAECSRTRHWSTRVPRCPCMTRRPRSLSVPRTTWVSAS